MLIPKRFIVFLPRVIADRPRVDCVSQLRELLILLGSNQDDSVRSQVFGVVDDPIIVSRGAF